jgi:hypothetical protein
MAKKDKAPVYVKLTGKGKLSIMLTTNVKSYLKRYLEDTLTQYTQQPKGQLNEGTIDWRIQMELLGEIYAKLFTELNLYRDSKVQLSKSEALALWWMYQEEVDLPFPSFSTIPPVGNLFMQLHQKLS